MEAKKMEAKKAVEKVPCSMCGKDSQVKEGWHMRHNINFCSSKCLNDFVNEFMVMTFDSVGKSEVKLKELENKINRMIKMQRKGG